MSEEENYNVDNFDDSSDRDDLITAEEAVEDNRDEETPDLESEDTNPDLDSDDTNSDDEVTQRAKKYGHLSKEEWIAQGKDPDQWKSPEEFDKVGKILEQVYALRHKVDQRDREIQALVEYQERTSKREYERAKQELEQKLAASKDDMDMEGVAHYTKELTRLDDMEKQEQQSSYQQQQQTALNDFKERNQHWFNDQNPDLVNRAVAIDSELKQKYPNASYDELAELIEAKMLREYPDRVGRQSSRPKAPKVAPSRSSVNKSAANKGSVKRTFASLSQEHKDTFNVYKRINPKITEAEFINRLKKDGEL